MENLLRSVSISPYLNELPPHLFDQVIKRLPITQLLLYPDTLLSLRKESQYWQTLCKELAEKGMNLSSKEWSLRHDSDAFQEYFYLRFMYLTMITRDIERVKKECNLIMLTSGVIVKELKSRHLCLPLLECGLLDQNNVDKVKTLWELMSLLRKKQLKLEKELKNATLTSTLFKMQDLQAALVNPLTIAIKVYAELKKINNVSTSTTADRELDAIMADNKNDLKNVLNNDRETGQNKSTSTTTIVDTLKRKILILKLLECIHICDATLDDFTYFSLKDPKGMLATKNKSRIKIHDANNNVIYSDVSIYFLRVLKETGTNVDWCVSEVLKIATGNDVRYNIGERVKKKLLTMEKVKCIECPLVVVSGIGERRRFDHEYDNMFIKGPFLHASLDFYTMTHSKYNVPLYLKESNMLGQEAMDRHNLHKFLKDPDSRLLAEITLVASLFDYHSKALDATKGSQLKSCLTFREYIDLITYYLSDFAKESISPDDLTALIKDFAQSQGLKVTEGATIKLSDDQSNRTLTFTNAYLNNPLYGFCKIN